MKKLIFCITLYLSINSILFAQNFSANGTVLNGLTENPLPNVNITYKKGGTISDDNGKFIFDDKKIDSLTFSHIGYTSVTLPAMKNMVVLMLPAALIGDPVEISAYKAISGVSPVSFSSLTKDEIELKYTAQDIPMVLASEPGVWAYSESGNGTGYSYATIRGFDQSRIAVMIDGVPLNDNESHQVYWVDHGDLLSDVEDIQIQRGIGTNLYGSSSFGGSINATTQIRSVSRKIQVMHGRGNWNTKQYRFKYLSGKDFGEKTSFAFRSSAIDSDGYRKEHGSMQRSAFIGFEHRGDIVKNQLRAIIGYENTQLTWDGISKEDIEDNEKRRMGYKAYTDDFLQQIYSLNSTITLNNNLSFRNVSYLVMGKGYYEVFKQDQDLYSYNLDINNVFTDAEEQAQSTDLLRRKWIDNNYYGIVPMLTYMNNSFRADFGGEFRKYTGDHYGEATNFSDPNLSSMFNDSWYRYYRYLGKKQIFTGFLRLLWSPVEQPFTVAIELQNQDIDWDLNQDKIGHAFGHQLSAPWNFFNPRLGLSWDLTDSLSWFASIGKAQKEPADNQIITADDMFSQPIMAASEVITNLELGMNFSFSNGFAKINGYRILYLNEQLKNINLQQEGEYSYYNADSTTHTGFEYESFLHLNNKTTLGVNGAIQMNVFNNGKFLPNTPSSLFNLTLQHEVNDKLKIYSHLRRVGGMYIDNSNEEEGYINSFNLLDVAAHLSLDRINLSLQIKNVLNKLYSTYGYSYEYNGYNAFYWPGATRNLFLRISYDF